MRRTLFFFIIFLLISCRNESECDCTASDPKLKTNIVILCNQGSGFLTIFDLNDETIIDSVDLHIKLQNWKNKGNSIDYFFIDSPRPHYVMTSSYGRFIYVILTAKIGAILKLDANFDVVNFLQITDTEYPAHAQISSENTMIYISAWTTNGGSASPDDKNMVISLNSDFTNRKNYRTPAGAHGIKLSKDESRLIVGHDLADFINDIDLDSLDREFPQVSAKAITATADQNGGNSTSIHSPTQVGISPDNKFAFFSCRKSSQLLVYDLTLKDTLGFIDLESLYVLQNAGPYSIEVGPKTNYESSLNKYAYINFKDAGGFARLKIDPNANSFENMFTASPSDYISLTLTGARPHGLDITDDGKKAVVSSEFSELDGNKAHIYFFDLEAWSLTKTIETKIHARGLTIYPGVGN